MSDSKVGAKWHVLIIEDEVGIRTMLESQLFQYGFAVSVAATGLHALQKFKSGQSYDLVLCDMKMPGMSGVDLFREYINLARSAPFVILTGHPDKKMIVEAIQLGVRDVILKPIRHTDLMHRIMQFLSEKNQDPGQAA